VPAGTRIRARFVLAALDESRPGEVSLTWDVTVEVEGQARPALAARWLTRSYLEA
jgi:acyl dehydratase